MATTILEVDKAGPVRFQARTGKRIAVGRTMGEALDALFPDDGELVDSPFVLLQRFRPDAFFGAAQIRRLQDLMGRRETLSEQEEKELEDLINAELDASADRSAALADALGR